MEFALIHLLQILEEHLRPRNDFPTVVDLEQVAVCQPDQEDVCVNREGHRILHR